MSFKSISLPLLNANKGSLDYQNRLEIGVLTSLSLPPWPSGELREYVPAVGI